MKHFLRTQLSQVKMYLSTPFHHKKISQPKDKFTFFEEILTEKNMKNLIFNLWMSLVLADPKMGEDTVIASSFGFKNGGATQLFYNSVQRWPRLSIPTGDHSFFTRRGIVRNIRHTNIRYWNYYINSIRPCFSVI